jgi:hypothetical protein
MPGGYVVFDYVDAECAEDAKEIEEKKFLFQWRERIERFVQQGNMEIVKEVNFPGYTPKVLICQKSGERPELPITGKIGLVRQNPETLEERRNKAAELREFYRNTTKQVDRDLERSARRDQEISELDNTRHHDTENITEKKLKIALTRLEEMLRSHEHHSIDVMQTILHISKLTFSLGRKRDSANIIKRAEKELHKHDPDSEIAKNYREWLAILNKS